LAARADVCRCHRVPPHGVDSLVFALKWGFDPDAARDLTGSHELRLAEDCFQIHIADGGLKTQRGHAETPDAIVETDPLWHRRSPRVEPTCSDHFQPGS
jgi:hypothetical protein